MGIDDIRARMAGADSAPAADDCRHESRRVRKRSTSDGRFQYVEQCTDCGRRVGSAIKREDACRFGHDPEPFDESLETLAEEQERQARLSHRGRRRSAWFSAYNDYLRTPEWAAIRTKVLRRSGGVCEGCGDHPATVVHHLTYQHVTDELLYELVAVCAACHDKAHQGGEQ